MPLVVVAKKHFAQILATARALLYAFTVDYGLSWFILIHSKGSRLETHIQVVGYRLNRLDEPIFIAVSKPLLTEFGIHLRLESCVSLSSSFLLIF